jgi:hypothetical protein
VKVCPICDEGMLTKCPVCGHVHCDAGCGPIECQMED